MTKRVCEENSFVGFEFLAAKPSFNSIEIYHPFTTLANEHFSNRGFEITQLETGSIKISFENLNKKEKIELAEEIKEFLKDSRREVIDKFLIYKGQYL